MEDRDLIISGASVVSGGRYRNVKISGAAKVTSSVSAETTHISGGVSIEGDIDSREIKMSGGIRISGSVRGSDVRISGGTSIDGNLQGDTLDLAGGTKVRGGLKGGQVKISGETSVGNDVECDELRVHGSIFCNETVNCGLCEIDLAGESEIRELVGSRITVLNKGRTEGGWTFNFKKLKLMNKEDSNLRAQTIEGDDIILENTTAEIVRGMNIRIGSGCLIKRVEYSGTYDVAVDARVDGAEKV